MKKLAFLLIMALGTLTASAQKTPHAIGAHFGGSTIDLEYQYHFSKRNFLDLTAGVFNLSDGFALQGVYNWNIKQWPGWTPRFATWKLWGGFGAGVGYYDHDDYEGAFLGPVGALGFGFTLKDVPLTLGVDYRPMVAINFGHGDALIDRGFRNIGVTLTYRF